MGSKARRRLWISLGVTLFCIYLPHLLPLFLGQIRGHEAAKRTWLSVFPILPGAALAELSELVLRHRALAVVCAAVLSLGLLPFLTRLGARNWRLQILAALLAFAIFSLNAWILDGWWSPSGDS